MSTSFLTLEQIIVIHEDQADRYGGSRGIRDLALLESAVFRPQSSFGGEELYLSTFDKAASLVHSLLLNHPFVDGNKRTATASMLVFLELNQIELEVKQEELEKVMLGIESKKMGLEEIAQWIKENS
ncbi:MAG: type II toxin-antitoxin system death-on-curing family toxin, partial [Candidatus Levyibacteriota bacterium]